MLSAKEAREKSELIHNEKVDADYLKLTTYADDAISKAIENGDEGVRLDITQSITLDAILKAIKALEDLGYTVDHKFQRGIRTIYINWGDA